MHNSRLVKIVTQTQSYRKHVGIYNLKKQILGCTEFSTDEPNQQSMYATGTLLSIFSLFILHMYVKCQYNFVIKMFGKIFRQKQRIVFSNFLFFFSRRTPKQFGNLPRLYMTHMHKAGYSKGTKTQRLNQALLAPPIDHILKQSKMARRKKEQQRKRKHPPMVCTMGW